MKQRLLISSLFIILINYLTPVNAQKQAWKWYFGYNAAVDFSSGVPVPLFNSAMYQWEGSASIADNDGNLLFYTDGTSAWNANHTLMPNGTGMLGNSSSTQSAMIVPRPNSDSIYYIFVTDGSTAHYSEVDMSLQGGLGDVTAIKNVLLSNNSAEKLAAVRSSNGEDIWVAIHGNFNSQFEAFLVTSTGVNTTSVASISGNSLVGNIGQLKFSPDGKKAAMASYGSSTGVTIELFDFDNVTGIFSNQIGLPTSYFQTYGLDFSPSGQILYSTAFPDVPNIHQWDLSSWDAASIIASDTILGFTVGIGGSVQIGPDHKIYISQDNNHFLAVVNNPEVLGGGCDYVQEGVDVVQYMGLGLPNFLASFFLPFTVENICFGDSTFLSVGDSASFTSVEWDFGDPSSGASNTASGNSVYHVFSSADTFNVVAVETFSGGSVDSVFQQVIIHQNPVLNFGNDTTICEGDTLVLDAGNAGANYLWSTGETGQSIDITATGTYAVQVSFGSCIAIDTLIVNPCPLSAIASSDTFLCQKFCTDFFDQSVNNPTSWLWLFPGGVPSFSTQQNPTNICYQTPGTYDVTLITTSASGTDTIAIPNYITVYPTPPFPTITQTGYTLTSSPASTYQWQFNSIDIPGATNQSYDVLQSGYYSVVISDQNGCVTSGTTYVLIVGIDGPANDLDVIINPNPSNGTFSIELSNQSEIGGADQVFLQVYNEIGQVVFSRKEKMLFNGAHVNLTNAAAGVYFIELKSENFFVKKKLIITK